MRGVKHDGKRTEQVSLLSYRRLLGERKLRERCDRLRIGGERVASGRLSGELWARSRLAHVSLSRAQRAMYRAGEQ